MTAPLALNALLCIFLKLRYLLYLRPSIGRSPSNPVNPPQWRPERPSCASSAGETIPPPSLPETLLLSADSLLVADPTHRGARKRSRTARTDDEALAGLMDRSTFISGRPSNENGNNGIGNNGTSSKCQAAAGAAAAARFRRVPGGDLSALVLAGAEGAASASASASGVRNKRVRVVDATLSRLDNSSSDDDDDNNNNGGKGQEGQARSTSDPTRSRSTAAAAPKKKRTKLVLDIVTARDVAGQDCDSDRLLNSGVEFWNSVASATAAAAGADGKGGGCAPGTPIMDPVTRAVDASLRAVFRHEKTVMQHLTYLRMDSLVLSMGPFQSTKWMKFLNHASSCSTSNGTSSSGTTTYGTVLHAAAIFNDLDGARCALELGIDVSLLDGDGHTASVVAETVGSTGVAAFLSSHIAMNGNDEHDEEEDDDDSDYVFDVYCLAGAKESARERDDWDAWEQSMGGRARAPPTPSIKDNKEDAKPNEINSYSFGGKNIHQLDGDNCSRSSSEEECRVEIKGGVGYWNEKGELVLEADKMNGGKGGANGDESFTEADDHDSNDEAYEGNDYPEDDEDGQSNTDDAYMRTGNSAYGLGAGYGGDYSSDEEGLALYGRSYRQDPVPIPASAAGGWSNVWSDSAQLADDSDDGGHNLSGFGMDDPDIGDDDGEYEGPLGRVTYGETGLYGEGGACAYDPEHDDEE